MFRCTLFTNNNRPKSSPGTAADFPRGFLDGSRYRARFRRLIILANCYVPVSRCITEYLKKRARKLKAAALQTVGL